MKFPHYIQLGSVDCGVACLQTILARFHIEFRKQSLKNIDDNTQQGLSMFTLINLLREHGVNSGAYEISNINELKTHLPAIALVTMNGLNHYIVVHEYNKKRFCISNPAEDNLTMMTENDFCCIFKNKVIIIEQVNKVPKKKSNTLYSKIVKHMSWLSKVELDLLIITKMLSPIMIFMIASWILKLDISKMSIETIILIVSFTVGITLFIFSIDRLLFNKILYLEDSLFKGFSSSFILNEIRNSKVRFDAEGQFWQMTIAINGVLNKYYFDREMVVTVILLIALMFNNLVLGLLYLLYIAVNFTYFNRIKADLDHWQTQIILKVSHFSKYLHEWFNAKLDFLLFSSNKRVSEKVRKEINNFSRKKMAISINKNKINQTISLNFWLFIGLAVASSYIVYQLEWIDKTSRLYWTVYLYMFMLPMTKSSFQKLIKYWESKSAIENINGLFNDDIGYTQYECADSNILNVDKIECKNLEITNNRKRLLKVANLKLESGSAYCIIGGNGVGKTSFLKTIQGLHSDFKGIITIDKNSYTSDNYYDLVQYSVLYTNELFLFDGSIGANISLPDYQDRLTVNVDKKMNNLVNSRIVRGNGKNLSLGEQQLLLLDRVLHTDSAIYLFDEPTNCLDQDMKYRFFQIIEQLKQKGKIIIMTTHDKDLMAVADNTYSIEGQDLERVRNED